MKTKSKRYRSGDVDIHPSEMVYIYKTKTYEEAKQIALEYGRQHVTTDDIMLHIDSIHETNPEFFDSWFLIEETEFIQNGYRVVLNGQKVDGVLYECHHNFDCIYDKESYNKWLSTFSKMFPETFYEERVDIFNQIAQLFRWI